jgi:hypothetical protein
MGWIVMAAVGGFFVGGIIFGLAGLAFGYVTSNKHNLAAGTAFLQNIATAQAKHQSQPGSSRVTASNLN